MRYVRHVQVWHVVGHLQVGSVPGRTAGQMLVASVPGRTAGQTLAAEHLQVVSVPRRTTKQTLATPWPWQLAEMVDGRDGA